MNYLELVNEFLDETEALGEDVVLTTVAGQIGFKKRLCRWISNEWVNIQNLCLDYDFLIVDHDQIVTHQSYTLAAMGITSWQEWRINVAMLFKTSVGESDENWITYITPDAMIAQLRGVQATGRPAFFTYDANGTLKFDREPDDSYTFRCQYICQPVVLAADNDIPACHSHHHQVIVSKALMRYGAAENLPELYGQSLSDYTQQLNSLDRDHKPMPTIEK